MKFGGIGVPELLIILAVALLIFGPKNLPKLGSALGKTVKNLRDGMGGDKDNETDIEEDDQDIAEDTVKQIKEKPVKKTAKKSATESSKTAETV